MRKIHVIACAVLKVDLDEMIQGRDEEITLQFLPGGLHDRPWELRERLQEAVDDASKDARLDRIAVGYGICGMGTVDIRSRGIPLAIPRVHDCISLFLGSDRAYREQFARYPGTYYVSAGWVEGKTQPQIRDRREREEFQRFAEQYGTDNARAIRRFMDSWKRNYQRAAYIDTRGDGEADSTPGGDGGAKGPPDYAAMARDMAESFGWRYERVEGSRKLLEELLSVRKTSQDILIVPPRYVTAFDPAGGKLRALPVVDAESTGREEGAVRDGGGRRTRFTVATIYGDEGDGQGSDRTAGEAPARPGRETDNDASSELGLGIDAGGTYTDAVLVDFRSDRVVRKAKAPTTPWDYTIGIDGALDGLDQAELGKVRLVSVSTTLATNSIVEDRGQRVGLLVMPPYGWKELENFKHDPAAVVAGQLEIDGTELAPVDPEEIRRVVRDMLERHDVKAFAVAGYASHANPAHELAVKRIIREETGMIVTCGHDVSEGLNYRVRAETAALNAGIIPYLEALFERIGASLSRRGVDAPITVVKSDGSLTSIQVARERPIETILSGPAASVAGARHLTREADALVVDMGGTTSDTAIIRDGEVKTCPEGAVVGGWETHVKALDMRTLGLGGDSLIAAEGGELHVGPRRVTPVALLAVEQPETGRALAFMERHLHYNESSTARMRIVALSGDGHTVDEDRLDERERRIVRALRGRPRCLEELAKDAGVLSWQLLRLDSLVERQLVRVCGLTPTDLLHAAGRMSLWSAEAAEHLCRIYGKVLNTDPKAFLERGLEEVVWLLSKELLKKQMSEHTEIGSLEASPVAMALVGSALGRVDGMDLSVRVALSRPVIGIGAPVHQFLPEACERLRTRAIIPEDADVANAIGAITSSVYVHKQVKISIDETGAFHLKGLPDAPTFASLNKAQEYAVGELRRIVGEMARRAGTSQRKIEIIGDDRVGSAADGSGVFLERILEARVTGRPDLERLKSLG